MPIVFEDRSEAGRRIAEVTSDMYQKHLFGIAAARTTDNEASHVAAEQVESSGVADRQRDQCLVAVRNWPGRTSKELARLSGLERHMLGRRLPELERRGEIRRDGSPWRCYSVVET